jgi:Cu+-exporting ATPase
MGTEADVTVENTGVTLVKGNLRGIVRARTLAKATMRNILQTLFFAFVYNTAGAPIAAASSSRCLAFCCRRCSPPPR